MSRIQQPLSSGFDRHTTSDQVMAGIDLRGRTAIVTGGHAGLGRETVRALAGAGACVIVPARRPTEAAQALAGLPRVQVAELDLAEPATIDAFAAGFLSRGEPLHLLINNAGIMATPERRDRRGHELQWSTNHLGHFQLTARLWPALVRSGGARVVTLSSGAHRFSRIDLEDPDFVRRPYDKWKAYGQSKTATALFALALDKRGAGHGVRAFSVHPGAIETGLGQHLDNQDLIDIGALDEHGQPNPEFATLYKSVEQGAATTLWCATSPRLRGLGGVYCEDCDIAKALPADAAELRGVLPWACDEQTAAALWQLSERQTGVAFDAGEV